MIQTIILIILLVVAAGVIDYLRKELHKSREESDAWRQKYIDNERLIENIYDKSHILLHKKMLDQFAEAEKKESFECHPVLKIKRELHVCPRNLDEIMQLINRGDIEEYTIETSSDIVNANIKVKLHDGQQASNGDWMLLDADDNWLIFSDTYHQKLVDANKIQLIK